MSTLTRMANGHGNAGTDVEGEISNLVSRDVVELRRQLANDGKMVSDVSQLLRRASVTSLHEIDELIGELEVLRDRLHYDGERMAREIVDYASLSLAAMQSARIIAQNLTYRGKVALPRFNGEE